MRLSTLSSPKSLDMVLAILLAKPKWKDRVIDALVKEGYDPEAIKLVMNKMRPNLEKMKVIQGKIDKAESELNELRELDEYTI